MKTNVKKLTVAAMLLALCMLLPVITGGIPEVGNAISPMHIPVFICGFVCGPVYGFAVGFIAPLMRSVLFSAPLMYPMAVSMAFELASYGLLCGILRKVFPKKNIWIYPSLIISMFAGRAVWGAARYVMAGLDGSDFGMAMFIAGAFTQAVPAIICHLLIVPPAVMVIEKFKK